MSIPIDAPEWAPGHVEPWRPQPWRDLGLSLGRLHDLKGGMFGSAIVRAMLGQAESAGTLGAQPMQEYAMQPFGIPGGMEPGSPKIVKSPQLQLAAHAHTVLALEEASLKFGRSDRVNATVPQGLQMALDTAASWTAPR